MSEVNKWTQEPSKQTNTIKQPQEEQMASRVGNPFPKRRQLSYINLTKYKFNLHNNK